MSFSLIIWIQAFVTTGLCIVESASLYRFLSFRIVGFWWALFRGQHLRCCFCFICLFSRPTGMHLNFGCRHHWPWLELELNFIHWMSKALLSKGFFFNWIWGTWLLLSLFFIEFGHMVTSKLLDCLDFLAVVIFFLLCCWLERSFHHFLRHCLCGMLGIWVLLICPFWTLLILWGLVSWVVSLFLFYGAACIHCLYMRCTSFLLDAFNLSSLFSY